MTKKNTKLIRQLKKLRIRKPRLKIFRTPAFILIFMHSIIFAGLFAGVALLANWLGNDSDLYWWIVLPTLLLGALHTWLMYTGHEWTHREEWGFRESLLTLLINLVGAFAVYLVIGSDQEIASFNLLAAMNSLVFLLPFVLDRTYFAHYAIPEKEYSPLQIKTFEDVANKIAIEPNDRAIIWQFEKGIVDREQLRMWMPTKPDPDSLSLQQIFKAFILYYNQEGVEDDFPYLENGESIQWQLFHRPLLSATRKMVNPAAGIAANVMRYKTLPPFKDHRGHTVKGVKALEIYVQRFAEPERNINTNENLEYHGND